MRKKINWITVFLGMFIILSVCLLGCSDQSMPLETIMDQAGSSYTDELMTESSERLKETSDNIKPARDNMVDERFELLSLVFRLAGKEEYGDADTEYQQNLISQFEAFSEHAAVRYAANLPLGYDAVFNFSVHIMKTGESFAFIDDIGSLVEDGRWTWESAAAFLPLLNDFYRNTRFAEFYQSNIDFYKNETKRFIDETYSDIELEWFRTYADPENLHSIYSPSNTRNNYSATVNGTMVYSSVTADGSAIVHEYCHSFANPIAHKWYKENSEFRQWCDDTLNPETMPFYSTGEIIAGEYVTRAYNTLYYTEHGYAPISLLLNEEVQGFPYIEEVYGLITEYEKINMSDIESILGVPYEMGEEQSISIGDREIRWKVLSLSEPLSLVYMQTEVGNAFDSYTGDVLYVEEAEGTNPFLLIDLGETTFQGEAGYRAYCRIPMELQTPLSN